MRFIAFILSIYILALNFTPCEDESAINTDIAIENLQNIDIEHNHDMLDLCSPFCQCQCCHINATHFNAEDFSLASNNISSEIFLHFDNLGKDILNSILQPPRT